MIGVLPPAVRAVVVETETGAAVAATGAAEEVTLIVTDVNLF